MEHYEVQRFEDVRADLIGAIARDLLAKPAETWADGTDALEDQARSVAQFVVDERLDADTRGMEDLLESDSRRARVLNTHLAP
jgi:hypothetical protein